MVAILIIVLVLVAVVIVYNDQLISPVVGSFTSYMQSRKSNLAGGCHGHAAGHWYINILSLCIGPTFTDPPQHEHWRSVNVQMDHMHLWKSSMYYQQPTTSTYLLAALKTVPATNTASNCQKKYCNILKVMSSIRWSARNEKAILSVSTCNQFGRSKGIWALKRSHQASA